MNLPFIPQIVAFARQHTLALVATVLVLIVIVVSFSGWRYYQYRQSSQYAFEILRDALKSGDAETIAELVDFNSLSRGLAKDLAQNYPFLKAGADQERQIADMIQTALLKQSRTKQEPV